MSNTVKNTASETQNSMSKELKAVKEKITVVSAEIDNSLNVSLKDHTRNIQKQTSNNFGDISKKPVNTSKNTEKSENTVKEISKNPKNGWNMVSAVRRGKSHVKTNTPCQDVIFPLCTDNKGMLLLADGAGSASNSKTGAQYTVDFFKDKLTEYNEFSDDMISELQESLKKLPYPYKSLASTFSGICFDDLKYSALQIGDSVMCVYGEEMHNTEKESNDESDNKRIQSDVESHIESDNKKTEQIPEKNDIEKNDIENMDPSKTDPEQAEPKHAKQRSKTNDLRRTSFIKILIPPENAEFANQTWMTTSSDLKHHSKILNGDMNDDLRFNIKGFCVMSDGIGRLLYDKRKNEFSSGLYKLFNVTEIFSQKEAQKYLDSAMDELFTKKSDDDCSIIIVAKIQKNTVKNGQVKGEERKD